MHAECLMTMKEQDFYRQCGQ